MAQLSHVWEIALVLPSLSPHDASHRTYDRRGSLYYAQASRREHKSQRAMLQGGLEVLLDEEQRHRVVRPPPLARCFGVQRVTLLARNVRHHRCNPSRLSRRHYFIHAHKHANLIHVCVCFAGAIWPSAAVNISYDSFNISDDWFNISDDWRKISDCWSCPAGSFSSAAGETTLGPTCVATARVRGKGF
jgi:hypothetical protein